MPQRGQCAALVSSGWPHEQEGSWATAEHLGREAVMTIGILVSRRVPVTKVFVASRVADVGAHADTKHLRVRRAQPVAVSDAAGRRRTSRRA
ncbi:hypothetical protein NPS01_09800 [Nocardioides psychrotolerans]|nr:hypothetical protein NPS01_09800 [Nocardioides psychrotolerans]